MLCWRKKAQRRFAGMMAIIERRARAKVNLSLHVTGQREDGYHLLDSLVVFADFGDRISVEESAELQLDVSGPFAEGVPTDARNIVWQAAAAIREANGITLGARIKLEKNLPHGAGIGGGSADAAAALDALSDLWDVPPLSPVAALKLGADVPVCMAAPVPQRMQGIGEYLHPVPHLPEAALVLVNPRIEVPTGEIFRRMKRKHNPAMRRVPEGMTYPAFAEWIAAQRNDMTDAACEIAPVIAEVLAALSQQAGIHAAVMSGSGATCVGLCPDLETAKNAGRALQTAHLDWWIAAAPMAR